MFGDSKVPFEETVQPEQLSRLLTWIFGIALVFALAGVIFVSMSPGAQEKPFTEFYLLGPNGTAEDYPTALNVNESGTFIVGITNHEHENIIYTVRLRVGNRTLADQSIAVADGATQEREFTFSPRTGGQKELQILLFKSSSPGAEAEPYRELRLLISVMD